MAKDDFAMALELDGIGPNELTETHEHMETCCKKCGEKQVIMGGVQCGSMDSIMNVSQSNGGSAYWLLMCTPQTAGKGVLDNWACTVLMHLGKLMGQVIANTSEVNCD